MRFSVDVDVAVPMRDGIALAVWSGIKHNRGRVPFHLADSNNPGGSRHLLVNDAQACGNRRIPSHAPDPAA